MGVTNETDEAKIMAFIEKHGMIYPVALDTKGTCARDYPSSGIPNATIVGCDGRIFWNGQCFESPHVALLHLLILLLKP